MKGTKVLEAYAESLGYVRVRTVGRKCHLKFRLPGTDAPQVVCAHTASDRRALHNAKADLRRVARHANQIAVAA